MRKKKIEMQINKKKKRFQNTSVAMYGKSPKMCQRIREKKIQK